MLGNKSLTMIGAQLIGLVLLVCTITLGTSSAKVSSKLQSKFYLRIDSTDVYPESSLPRRLRNLFGGRLKARFESVDVDLNDDGQDEKFATIRSPNVSGTLPWFIFDPEEEYYIAYFDATIIYVLNERHKGYRLLECLCLRSDDSTLVDYYSYDGDKYRKTKTILLQKRDIDKFFKERKGVPHPWELRPDK
jgi:hypothetical protein